MDRRLINNSERLLSKSLQGENFPMKRREESLVGEFMIRWLVAILIEDVTANEGGRIVGRLEKRRKL